MIPFIFNNQVENVKKKLQKHIDKGDRALIMAKSIYSPDSATTVTFTKLYPHFVYGYTYNKASGVKVPYTMDYNTLICHDYNDLSQWEDGTPLNE